MAARGVMPPGFSRPQLYSGEKAVPGHVRLSIRGREVIMQLGSYEQLIIMTLNQRKLVLMPRRGGANYRHGPCVRSTVASKAR
jgi:hypothetical protein